MTILTSYLSAAGDGAEGASGTSPMLPTLPPGAVRGDAAIAQITEMYRVLQAQASRIDRVYGAAIPCDVQTHHNEGVKAYQKAAQSVFDQILAQNQKYEIVQYMYNPDGSVMSTTKRNRPLIPAVYNVVGCPSNAPMSGSLHGPTLGQFGIAPLIWIAIAVVIGATTVSLAYVVIKNWPLAAVETAKAQSVWVATQLDCVERMMKDRKLSTGAAVQACKGIVGEAPKASSSWGLWALVLGVGGLGGYGLARALRRGD